MGVASPTSATVRASHTHRGCSVAVLTLRQRGQRVHLLRQRGQRVHLSARRRQQGRGGVARASCPAVTSRQAICNGLEVSIGARCIVHGRLPCARVAGTAIAGSLHGRKLRALDERVCTLGTHECAAV